MDAGTSAAKRSAAPAVLVVGGKPKIVRKARALGLDVVLFQHPAAYTEEHAAHVTSAFLFDIGDVRLALRLAAAVAARWPVRHALSLTEDGLPVAGAITDALGLPGTGAEVARLCRDKWAMRQVLAGTTGGAVPAVAAELFTDETAMLRFGAAHGWPLIVKPADHSASVGVLLVAGPDDVAVACRQVRAWQCSTEAPFHRADRFVLEEHLDGPEISVEAFSAGGRHVILAITEKLLHGSGFVEIGHALPARLVPSVAADVRRATAALLDAVGLRDGPSHTEFRLSGGVPRLIETHNRVGGDRIHDLVEAATGVDQDSLWIGGPAGLAPPLRRAPHVGVAAATRFLLAEPGQVVAIVGADEVRAHPGVIGLDLAVGVGDRVAPLRTSWDRVGQVLVTAPTTRRAVALADELAGRIRVVTR